MSTRPTSLGGARSRSPSPTPPSRWTSTTRSAGARRPPRRSPLQSPARLNLLKLLRLPRTSVPRSPGLPGRSVGYDLVVPPGARAAGTGPRVVRGEHGPGLRVIAAGARRLARPSAAIFRRRLTPPAVRHARPAPRPVSGARGLTRPGRPARQVSTRACWNLVLPPLGFHLCRETLSGHGQGYPFLFHSADPVPGRVGEVQVEKALVWGQRGEVPPRQARDQPSFLIGPGAAGLAADAGVDAELPALEVTALGVDLDMAADVNEVLPLCHLVGLAYAVDEALQAAEPGLDLPAVAKLGRVGRERLQLPAERGDVLGLGAPQVDVKRSRPGPKGRRARISLTGTRRVSISSMDSSYAPCRASRSTPVQSLTWRLNVSRRSCRPSARR